MAGAFVTRDDSSRPFTGALLLAALVRLLGTRDVFGLIFFDVAAMLVTAFSNLVVAFFLATGDLLFLLLLALFLVLLAFSPPFFAEDFFADFFALRVSFFIFVLFVDELATLLSAVALPLS